MVGLLRRTRAGSLAPLPVGVAVCCAVISCSEVPPQGTAVGDVVADGAGRSVFGDVSAGTIAQSDGWVALEVLSLSSSADGQGAPDIGPLCLWVSLDRLAQVGSLSLSDPWQTASLPFTASAWYCQPGSDLAPLFLGIRCETPQNEEVATPEPGVIIDLTPAPPPVTPTILPNPGYGADAGNGTAATSTEGDVGSLVATSGQVEVVTAAAAPCDRVELRLTNVTFENQSCEGPVTSLAVVDLTIQAQLLPPGRDWATGGYASCD